MTVLVTGAAGFIGSHLVSELVKRNQEVVAIDNYNDYYAMDLKELRFSTLVGDACKLIRCDLNDRSTLIKIFEDYQPTQVFHLAAQAGVRLTGRSIDKYVESNITAFHELMQCCVEFGVDEIFFASSSSVYGNSTKLTLSESDSNLVPISFYGVTKYFNELSVAPYIRETSIRAVGMRFFTVYGPWGRPDMAYFRIAANLISGRKFILFGNGEIRRDFTHIQDVVESMILLQANVKKLKPGAVEIFNVGGGRPHSIHELITSMEKAFNKKLNFERAEANLNDVDITHADFTKLQDFTGYRPRMLLYDGVSEIAKWFLDEKIETHLSDWIESTV